MIDLIIKLIVSALACTGFIFIGVALVEAICAAAARRGNRQ